MKKIAISAAVLFAAFMAFGMFIRMTDPQSDARVKDRRTIDYCEKHHSGGNNWMCQSLKAGYREKYNREP